MLKDRARLKLKAGNGGTGKVAYNKQLRPNGGNGGDGGSIYLLGTTSEYDFRHLRTEITYEAENGNPGKINNANGRGGKDLTIRVPLATNIYNKDRELVMTIDKPDEPVLFLKGGRGGIGNYYFRTKGRHNRGRTLPPDPGEQMNPYFILELASDVIFIGYPNAGKSSILSELTNADVKVASYAFTTIDPQLGITKNGITLMDLPGLIEGTSEGKGVGTKFLKHTRRAKLLAHFVRLDNVNIVEAYKDMRKVIDNLGADLANKPEIIVLSMSDMIEPDIAKGVLKEFKKLTKGKIDIEMVSAYDDESLNNLVEKLEENVRAIS